MKLIKPYYEVLNEEDFYKATKSIEIAARTCKKSEKYINETSGDKIAKLLIEDQHDAMLEFGPSFTVKFVCDRGVSHELVRHRLCSFAQESTRYCNYSKAKFDNQITFIIPSWIEDISEGEYPMRWVGTVSARLICDEFEDDRTDENSIWFWSMANSEVTYNRLCNSGWKPQQARSVLPNSLKTEIVVKANIREWRHIFILRTSPKAHSQMRELMIPLLKHFQTFMPSLFNDIII
jgi:thymidylate synthase (FAD)